MTYPRPSAFGPAAEVVPSPRFPDLERETLAFWQRDGLLPALLAPLAAVYAYFERTEGMMARAENESPANAVLAEFMTPFHAHWAAMRDQLAAAWNVDGAPNPLVAAAIGHALAFTTWRSLARLQGLSREHAIALMLELVRAAARSELG
ncbi:MAG: hypothetical protein J0I66_11425 [Microbacterium sp.]|nr:hypothetical protein [Microbacterium sp.]